MSTITYKCPNCDADLTYRPATGDFGCEYCGSSYTGEQLNELIKNQKIIDEQKESEGTAFDEHAVVYTCPNCGAEVITDDTTAATFCFYCHNPVILKGRLSGGMAPDKVIPFSIPKEKVKEQLISWCKSKKYIDDGFFSEMQLEKLTGVYFPFWLVDSDIRATMTAKSNSLKVWVVGDIEYTETSVYALTRSGDVKLSEITVKALDRKDAELLNGVYPYDMSGLKDFNMSFLSGFMAEKRNIILTLAIGGALAGLGASLLYQTGYEQWQCTYSSVPSMGFNGIAAAFLGGLSPIGSIFASFFIQHITAGGAYVDKSLYCSQISDLISAIIIYLCSFVLFFKTVLSSWIARHEEKKARKAAQAAGKGGEQA